MQSEQQNSLRHIIALKCNCMFTVKGLLSCEIAVSATISDVGLILVHIF